MDRRRDLSDSDAQAGADEFRLAALALTFLVIGIILSLMELSVNGTITVPGIGLTIIGVVLLPIGLLRFTAAQDRSEGDGPADDGEDDGGSGGGPRPAPEPPRGGLSIDWDRFEREFAAYVEAVTAPALAAAA